MLQDGLILTDTGVATNFSIDHGTSLPTTGNNLGELFYLTSGTIGLYIYNGTAWVQTGSAAAGSSDAGALTGTTLASNVINSSLANTTAAFTVGASLTFGAGTVNPMITTTSLNGTSSTLTIQPAIAIGASTNGSAVTIQGGTANYTTAGALNLFGGAGTASGGNGGAVNITGGTNVTSGLGGDVVITGGPAASVGGAVRITGGYVPSAGSARGSDVFIKGGALTGTASGTAFDGSVVLGKGSLSTTAVGGYVYIPTVAGAPTGSPATSNYSGFAPIAIDSTNDKMMFYTNGQWHSSAAGSGTVTSVSVTAANGVSGSVATGTTTPAITLSLGAITPTSVAATGTISASNFSGTHAGASSGTNTGDNTTAQLVPAQLGNAGKFLTTDGATSSWGNIVASAAAAGTLTGTTLASNVVISSLTTLGTLGSLAVTGNITAADPTANTQVATKQYVDNLIVGLSWKNTVVTATTANITLSGTQTIDGIALTAGQRVLVKNQTTAADNGIYVVAAGAWARSPDAATATSLDGAAVYAIRGTVNADTSWTETASLTTLGTDPVTFVQFSASIGGTSASSLVGTTLATNVVTSSLTSVGTLSALTLGGTLTVGGTTGTSGYVLTSNGGAAPTWQPTASTTAAAGTLTGTTLAANVVNASLSNIVSASGVLIVKGPTNSTAGVNISGGGGAIGTAGGAVVIAGGTGDTSQVGGNLSLSAGSSVSGTAFDGNIIFNGRAERFRITNTGAWSIGPNGTDFGSSGQVLTSAGNAPPTWTTLSTSAAAAGTLTGTTLAANVVSSSLTSVGTLAGLTLGGALTVNSSAGTSGQVLTSNGSGAPSWATPTAGTAAAGTLTGTTLATNVVSSSLTSVGTLGSLAITGALSFGGVLTVGGSNGTAGQVLTSNGGSAPTWQTASAGSANANTLTGTTLASNVVNASLTTIQPVPNNGTGTALNLTAGTTSSGSAGGGAVNITATSGAGTLGFGGAVTITAGPAVNGQQGGYVSITGGAGVSNNGGNAALTGGSSSGAAGGGAGLYGGTGATAGGPVAIFTAPSTSHVQRLSILANGAWSVGTNASATGSSGQFLMSTGATTPPQWFPVTIDAGNLTGATLAANVVNATLGTIKPASTGTVGTSLNLYAGDTTAASQAGAVNVTGGTSATGLGGQAVITGGTSSGNGNGGALILNGGQSNGSGTGGNVVVQAGLGGGAGGYFSISTALTNSAFVERLRITNAGAWLLAGTTGTTGQVLTSNASGVPSWATPSGGAATALSGGATGQIPYQTSGTTTGFSANFLFDGTATVTVGAAASTGTVKAASGTGATGGGNLFLRGGAASGTSGSTGGVVALIGGTGAANNGTAGDVQILSGAPGAGWFGGAVLIQAGDGVSGSTGAPGAVTLRGGDTSGNGGSNLSGSSVTIRAGNTGTLVAGQANVAGGDLNLTAGFGGRYTGSTAGAGGNINITSGAGGVPNGGTGARAGDITITGGLGGNLRSGNVTVQGGASVNTNNAIGGAVLIAGGDGDGGGGSLTLRGGNSSGTAGSANGGNLILAAGTRGGVGSSTNGYFSISTTGTERLRIIDTGAWQFAGAGGSTGQFVGATAAGLPVWTSLSSTNITTALGYAPVNKAGDTTSGTITSSVSAGGTIAGFVVTALGPAFGLSVTGQPVDAKTWDIFGSTNSLSIRAVNDANNAAVTALQIFRGTGTAISRVSFASPVTVGAVGSNVTDPLLSRVDGCAIRADGSIDSRTASGATGFGIDSNTGTNIQFYTDSGSALVSAGFISSTSSTTSYNTTSDERLKTQIVDLGSQGSVIDALQVREFEFKAEPGAKRKGFIAQELVQHAPEAVTRGNDGIIDKPEDTWGVDLSKLIPMLVKEIQDLRARLAVLESK